MMGHNIYFKEVHVIWKIILFTLLIWNTGSANVYCSYCQHDSNQIAAKYFLVVFVLSASF